MGKKDDLKDILDQIKDRNITALDVTLTNLTILEDGVFRNVQTLSALVISSSRLQVRKKFNSKKMYSKVPNKHAVRLLVFQNFDTTTCSLYIT